LEAVKVLLETCWHSLKLKGECICIIREAFSHSRDNGVEMCVGSGRVLVKLVFVPFCSLLVTILEFYNDLPFSGCETLRMYFL